MGESGSGKSTSLRNFEPGEIGIFNVASKPLPFRKKLPTANGVSYEKIKAAISNPKLKAYAIDDSQYLMAFESFKMAKVAGYGKFTDMAVNFYDLVKHVIEKAPPDVIVYFLQHCETTDSGKLKAKTLGKMIDSQLTLEGLFSIVLMCQSTKEKHIFVTQSDGTNTCKSPMDMLPAEMDNDLKEVDRLIREYWGLANLTDGNKEEPNNATH